MPLTAKGRTIEHNMEQEYGPKKGESVFYASRNAGKIKGVDAKPHTLWSYNRAGGWKPEHQFDSPEEAETYKQAFQRVHPNGHFHVSKTRPAHNPLKPRLFGMIEQ
jgi:hypothetical protein